MSAPHAWLPRATCVRDCLNGPPADRGVRVITRTTLRSLMVLLLLPCMPLLAVPVPGRRRWQRGYCRAVLRCLGIRISVSGGPIRNVSGVLVVARHVSWVDVFVVGAVLPGSFVAKAEMLQWPALGAVARMVKVIPIDRTSLRRLPEVVRTIADRLRSGHTVVAFPEGTTWCGRAHGHFRPAMFQAAIDAQRAVQPLRLSYHHRDGELSTVCAYIGEDTLLASLRRVISVRRTLVRVGVESLQLPGDDRRELAARCQRAVGELGAAATPLRPAEHRSCHTLVA
ncbi:1-acyl-sn-glycerol-3-phosphate acyltransferase [Mycobacterium sp. SMC-4]|uniref:lysophospholipid acyltransferase family protein n=1 Tax=Mycobacterium sp. SMC-4 TaxID=2857059 RepID=UPI0021B17AD0|nr:lysophospholipid acyltransferase family protein [Mycobacterium sp. SMC-4]UXA19692.1 1-acyl-sn-glycerol-3-phosphate acyltransferase [Mycobacterium sp. SMC-4]